MSPNPPYLCRLEVAIACVDVAAEVARVGVANMVEMSLRLGR